MDDKRFDALTRLFGSGASRRSVLKGLLGLGAAAVTVDETDARARRGRPTIPPPPPPTTPAPTTTTAAPCPGQEQCPNSTLCCPTGTCARSGNQAICCDGTNGHGSAVCGLECCDSPYECCDNECCAAGHTCLTTVFDEGPGVEEEVCCPAHLACDNQCCDGSCFDLTHGLAWDDEFGTFFFNGHPLAVASFECCPAGDTVCQVGFPEFDCCGGDTPKCCPVDFQAETPGACRAADACCDAADCADDHPGTDAACWTCDAGTCVPVENDVSCGMGDEVCCDQVCCAAGQICVEAPNGEAGAAQEAHICITINTTTTTTEACLQEGTQDCAGATLPCCSGFCISNVCADGCSATGEPCNGPLHCCTDTFCNSLATCGCRTENSTCINSGDCCASAPHCTGSTQQSPLFCLACIPEGNICPSGNGCCDDLTCSGGTCQPTTTTTTTLQPCQALQTRCLFDGLCHDCCQSSDCVDNFGFDTNCVFCTLENVCQPGGALLGNACGTTSGICDENGQCVECFDVDHPCQDPHQCCDFNFGATCNNNFKCTGA